VCSQATCFLYFFTKNVNLNKKSWRPFVIFFLFLLILLLSACGKLGFTRKTTAADEVIINAKTRVETLASLPQATGEWETYGRNVTQFITQDNRTALIPTESVKTVESLPINCPEGMQCFSMKNKATSAPFSINYRFEIKQNFSLRENIKRISEAEGVVFVWKLPFDIIVEKNEIFMVGMYNDFLQEIMKKFPFLAENYKFNYLPGNPPIVFLE
jgi:hypothetical protein